MWKKEEQLPTQWSRKVLARCVTTPSHAATRKKQKQQQDMDTDYGYGIWDMGSDSGRKVEGAGAHGTGGGEFLLLARLRARYANLHEATLAAKELPRWRWRWRGCLVVGDDTMATQCCHKGTEKNKNYFITHIFVATLEITVSATLQEDFFGNFLLRC